MGGLKMAAKKQSQTEYLKDALAKAREQGGTARTAVAELQYWLSSAATEMERAQQALRCSAEFHRLKGDTAHAELSDAVAVRLSFDINRARKLCELTVDAAIADLTIPF